MKRMNHDIKVVSSFVEKTYDKNNIAIFNLINKFFWKSKLAPMSMFGLPLLFMFIYFAISSSVSGSSFRVLDGFNLYISFAVMPISLVSLPQLLVEIKNSIILRRIAISNISAFRYNFLMSTYFFGMCVISTLFIFAAVSIFEYAHISAFFSSFNMASYIYALINFYIVSISLGIILSSIFKSSTWVQLIGLAVILFSLMLSGQFIPIRVIADILPIKIISLFSPLDYALGLMNNVLLGAEVNIFLNQLDLLISITDPNAHDYFLLNNLKNRFPIGGRNIFNFSDTFALPNAAYLRDIMSQSPTWKFDPSFPIYETWEKSTNIVFPYLFVIGSTYLSVNRFSWSSR